MYTMGVIVSLILMTINAIQGEYDKAAVEAVIAVVLALLQIAVNISDLKQHN